MQCKSCGYADSHVVETKRNEELKQIIRRRECIKCGLRYTTQEHIHHNKPNYRTPPPKRILDK